MICTQAEHASSITHIMLSLGFPLFARSIARAAYSDSGVSSSVSSSISSPNRGRDLYFHTARSLCTQQRPACFERRGLSSNGRRSILSVVSSPFFHNFTSSVSNLCLVSMVNTGFVIYYIGCTRSERLFIKGKIVGIKCRILGNDKTGE